MTQRKRIDLCIEPLSIAQFSFLKVIEYVVHGFMHPKEDSIEIRGQADNVGLFTANRSKLELFDTMKN